MTRYRNARYLAEIQEDLDEEHVIQPAPEPDAELGAEEKTFKQRYGDLRRHQQAEKAEYERLLQVEREKADQALRAAVKYPKTEDEVAKWMKDFPDVAGIVQTIALKTVHDNSGDTAKTKEELASLKSELASERALQRLLKKHPDFLEIRADSEFHEWAKLQPKWVQAALYENESDDEACARVIDLYKMDSQKSAKAAAPARDVRRESATAVRSPSASQPFDGEKRKWKESEVDKMNPREYERYEDDIEKAMREGRFEYDLSGAAR